MRRQLRGAERAQAGALRVLPARARCSPNLPATIDSSTHHPRRDATSTRRPRASSRATATPHRHPSCGPPPARPRPSLTPPPPSPSRRRAKRTGATSSLERKGVLTKLKAELRAHVFEAVQQQDGLEPPPDDPTAPSRAATSPPRSSAEYLEWAGLDYSRRLLCGSRRRGRVPRAATPSRTNSASPPAKDPSSRRFSVDSAARKRRRRAREEAREGAAEPRGSRGLWDGRARGRGSNPPPGGKPRAHPRREATAPARLRPSGVQRDNVRRRHERRRGGGGGH